MTLLAQEMANWLATPPVALTVMTVVTFLTYAIGRHHGYDRGFTHGHKAGQEDVIMKDHLGTGVAA